MTVPQDDFNALWEEFEAFKQTSQDLESKLNEQLTSKDHEIRHLARQYADAIQQRDDYRQRLHDNLSNEDELRSRIAAQESDLERLRAAKRKLEDDLEMLERVQRGDTFRFTRLEAERDAALDRAILAESRVAELEEDLDSLRRTCAELKDEVERQRVATVERCAVGATEDPVCVVAVADNPMPVSSDTMCTPDASETKSVRGRIDASQFQAIAERIRRAAAACEALQMQGLQSSHAMVTDACALGFKIDDAASHPTQEEW